jgi:hypothetical protein
VPGYTLVESVSWHVQRAFDSAGVVAGQLGVARIASECKEDPSKGMHYTGTAQPENDDLAWVGRARYRYALVESVF